MHDELVWVLGTRIFSDHERSLLRIVGKWAYACLFGGSTCWDYVGTLLCSVLGITVWASVRTRAFWMPL